MSYWCTWGHPNNNTRMNQPCFKINTHWRVLNTRSDHENTLALYKDTIVVPERKKRLWLEIAPRRFSIWRSSPAKFDSCSNSIFSRWRAAETISVCLISIDYRFIFVETWMSWVDFTNNNIPQGSLSCQCVVFISWKGSLGKSSCGLPWFVVSSCHRGWSAWYVTRYKSSGSFETSTCKLSALAVI